MNDLIRADRARSDDEMNICYEKGYYDAVV